MVAWEFQKELKILHSEINAYSMANSESLWLMLDNILNKKINVNEYISPCSYMKFSNPQISFPGL